MYLSLNFTEKKTLSAYTIFKEQRQRSECTTMQTDQ